MRAEIANLVKRVPRRHLDDYFSAYVRYFHADVKNVSLWMVKGNAVPDSSCRAMGQERRKKTCENEPEK
jgi:hypothetical protein